MASDIPPIVSELAAELWLGVKIDPELGSPPDVCESGILLYLTAATRT